MNIPYFCKIPFYRLLLLISDFNSSELLHWHFSSSDLPICIVTFSGTGGLLNSPDFLSNEISAAVTKFGQVTCIWIYVVILEGVQINSGRFILRQKSKGNLIIQFSRMCLQPDLLVLWPGSDHSLNSESTRQWKSKKQSGDQMLSSITE